MRKLTKEEFIKKCIKTHGNEYDYSDLEYINISSKVSIVCRKHGIFKQNAKNHRDGQGCPRCYGRNQPILEFINKCTKIHNDRYDYSLVTSLKKKSHIRIIDKKTGIIYKQIASHHEMGITPTKMEKESLLRELEKIHNNRYSYIIDEQIVRYSEKIKLIDNITKDEFIYCVDKHLSGMKPNRITLNYFLSKSKEIHSDKYNYSLVKEISGGKSKVNIICNTHGIFTQRVSNHINLGNGCPKCVGKGRWSNEMLILEFTKVHLNRYDYSNLEFSGINNKVKIICKDHGQFLQNIHKHLKGQGCPECSFNSKGEEYIKNHLEDLKIKYIRQHGFDTCRYINKLSFDFYLPELETCIEFDGIQHFKPINDFGGKKEFKIIQERDKCKNKWCIENGVNLIRIKYDQIDKIREILNNEFKTHKTEVK